MFLYSLHLSWEMSILSKVFPSNPLRISGFFTMILSFMEDEIPKNNPMCGGSENQETVTDHIHKKCIRFGHDQQEGGDSSLSPCFELIQYCKGLHKGSAAGWRHSGGAAALNSGFPVISCHWRVLARPLTLF